MILIENKLNIFEDIVYKSRLLQFEQAKEKIETEKERLIEEKKKELDEETRLIVDRRENLARVLGNEEIAKAKEERRILQLKKMGELENELIEAVSQKAKAFADDPQYEAFLMKGIRESIDFIEAGNYRLGLVQKDLDKYFDKIQALGREKNIEFQPVVMEDRIIGGHVISDQDNTYNLNNDLRTMIEEKKYEIGKLLHMLFHEEESNE